MLTALLTLAAEAAEHEPDKTAFYVAAGVLAVWAVAVSAFGMSRADFPSNDTATRGVMAISAVLVLAAMAAAVATG